MAEIRGSGTWGSALTTDEFAAIRSVGFEPVGQVLGAAVYSVGYTGGYNCPGSLVRVWSAGIWCYASARRAKGPHFRYIRPYRGGVRGASVDGSYEGYAKDALSS